MGNKTEVAGGGKAKGVSADFLTLLRGLIGGNQGAGAAFMDLLDPNKSTQNITDIQNRQKSEDFARLRAQFGMNTSSGSSTPNAVASSRYLADRAPGDAQQVSDYVDQRRAQALQFLMPAFQQAVGIGTPQAQLIQKPTLGKTLFDTALGAGTTIAGVATGNPFAAAGGLNKTITGLGQGSNFGGGGYG